MAEYGKVLANLQFEDHPHPPRHVTAQRERKNQETMRIDAPPFPELDTREVDMTRYNTKEVELGGGDGGFGAADFRQLHLYRIV